MRTRLLLADDHAVVLQGLLQMLDTAEFEIVRTVRDGHALVEAAVELQPDLIIADISMPILNGIDATRRICAHNARAKIIFFSMHPEVIYAVEAINAGAKGYLVKSADNTELITAMRSVLAGEIYITPLLAEPVMSALRPQRRSGRRASGALTHRQREVLQLLAEGKAPKEIAGILKISERTVEFHKYRIMDTLGLKTVPELAVYAAKTGLMV